MSDSTNLGLPKLTMSEFQELVKNSTDLYFLDFYADWCGPCNRIMPEIERLSKDPELTGIKFYKVNADEEPELSKMFGVRAIPNFIIIKFTGDGQFDPKTHTIGDINRVRKEPLSLKMGILDHIKQAGGEQETDLPMAA